MHHKSIALLTAPAGVNREHFQQETLCRLSAAPSADVVRIAVNLVDVEPPSAAGESPSFDVAVQQWWRSSSGAPVVSSPLASLLRAPGGGLTEYLVRETVQKSDGRVFSGSRAKPGIKVIYLVRRHEHLSNQEAKARWSRHAGTAREHHVGMSQYIQNGVIRPLTPGAPLVHGIAELHFPTRGDLETRIYGTVEGRTAVQQDVDGLVAETIVLFTTEYHFAWAPIEESV
jgi:hypothetical protein